MKCKHPFTGPHTTMTYSCHLYHSSSFTVSSIETTLTQLPTATLDYNLQCFISVPDNWPLLQSA